MFRPGRTAADRRAARAAGAHHRIKPTICIMMVVWLEQVDVLDLMKVTNMKDLGRCCHGMCNRKLRIKSFGHQFNRYFQVVYTGVYTAIYERIYKEKGGFEK